MRRCWSVFVLLMLSVVGCTKQDGASVPQKIGGGMGTVTLKHSGYVGNVADWKRFLSCWQDHYAPPDDLDAASLLQGKVRSGKVHEAQILVELDAAEKRLGIKLPKSYRDFMLAFSPVPRPESREIDNHLGLFPVSQIGFLEDLTPHNAVIAEENPVEASDEKYFIYGADQDYIFIRSSYLRKSILIGKYGEGMFERIVLYPQVTTKDGEMEAAIGFHTGQFRAPSFAEMMRQLSYSEQRFPDAMPPYAQDRLHGMCADHLPMKDVWWR